METNRINSHRENLLLASLSASDFALLQPGLIQTDLQQGTVLHDVNDTIETVYFPQSGMVSLLAVMDDGAAIEVGTAGRHSVVGAMTGIGVNRANTRAVSQLAGKGSKISAAKFLSAVSNSPTLRELIIRYKESLLVQAQSIAACNSLHNVEERLCRWILLSADYTESDEVNLTQEFLAEMLGVNRTSVTLMAQTLQKAGLIHYKRGHIKIVDRIGLEKQSCECYATIRQRMSEIFSKYL